MIRKYVVITGNLATGIETVFGTFLSFKEAQQWGENDIQGRPYVIRELQPEYSGD